MYIILLSFVIIVLSTTSHGKKSHFQSSSHNNIINNDNNNNINNNIPIGSLSLSALVTGVVEHIEKIEEKISSKNEISSKDYKDSEKEDYKSINNNSINEYQDTDTDIYSDNDLDNGINRPIHEYIQAMTNERSEMVLLKWNMNGILENNTDLTYYPHLDWVHSFFENDFKYTTPSQYGKVAMIFVCDVILFIPWNIIPPIPVLLYTIHKDHYLSTNYILIPNPYDQCGYSEWQVDKLLKQHSTTLLNTTYTTFHQRNNTLIWRGKDHGEKLRFDLINYTSQLQMNVRNQQQQNQQEQQYSQQQKQLQRTLKVKKLNLNGKTKNKISLSSSSSLWLDAKFSNGEDTTSISEEILATHYKYHLDVGGVSGTSWEGLRWKMCSGNLVFHIDSGAMDWWHTHLQAGIHYIEIKEDLSNLYEQYVWAETHPIEAYVIAQRGQQVCLHSYHKECAKISSRNIVHTLPDATLEQIQESDVFFKEYYTKRKSSSSSSRTTTK